MFPIRLAVKRKKKRGVAFSASGMLCVLSAKFCFSFSPFCVGKSERGRRRGLAHVCLAERSERERLDRGVW